MKEYQSVDEMVITAKEKMLIEALENIKKHIEFSCPTGYEMSAAWNIANNALAKA